MSFAGNTPLVSLRFADTKKGSPEILAKLEYRNPTGSIKDRVAEWYLKDLASKHLLKPGVTLVIPTTGNLAVALASKASIHGYRVIAVVPETTSFGRIQLIKAMGAEIVRTPAGVRSDSDESQYAVARRIASGIDGAIVIDESTSTFDPVDCYAGLAQEIIQQCGDKLDALAVGVESGGEILGLGRHLRKHYPAIKIIGVLPDGAVIEQEAGAHFRRNWKIEDIGTDIATVHIKAAHVDDWIYITDRDAYSTARHLIRESSVLPGPSGGAVVAAARKYAETAGIESARIVAIINDGATAYQTTLLHDDWLLEHDLADAQLTRSIQHELLEKYRGASVEDLQLPAAVTVRGSTTVTDALDLMIEREFSQLPVVDDSRKMIGFVYDADLRALLRSNAAAASDPVEKWMHSFRTHGKGRRTYHIITPDTPLAELARFFEHHSAAFVTDADRRWCLAVATKYDLIRFMTGRRMF